MYNHGIGMRIHVNGRACKEYTHQGMCFVESRHGSQYTVKLKNDNSYKAMAVLSVDGINVITGKPADESDSKGYILDGYSSIEIKGYRISEENSAAFIFFSKDGERSYVKATGNDARNSGVIGVRVFKEKIEVPSYTPPTIIHQHHYVPTPYCVYPWNPYPVHYVSTGGQWISTSTSGATASATYTTTGANCSATDLNIATNNNSVSGTSNAMLYATNVNFAASNNLAASNNQLRAASISNAFDSPINHTQFDSATGWGKKLDDKVRKEYFKKGDLLTELVMYYSTRNTLVNMGIDLTDSPKVTEEQQMPKAFKSKYCEPPKGWVG